MELTAVLTPSEEGGYVALNPETGTTTQGRPVKKPLQVSGKRLLCTSPNFRCPRSDIQS